jgi:hypothetical protein
MIKHERGASQASPGSSGRHDRVQCEGSQAACTILGGRHTDAATWLACTDLGSAPAVTLENGLAAEDKWLADYL